MTPKAFLLLVGGALAAALGVLLNWVQRQLARLRAAVPPHAEDQPVTAIVVQPVERRARWPRAASRVATEFPAAPGPRLRRGPLGSRADLRRVIVLATILGPCRASAISDEPRITPERRP